MDMIEFNKMTEEIEEVANKYGLTIDFGTGTIGEETRIELTLCKVVKARRWKYDNRNKHSWCYLPYYCGC